MKYRFNLLIMASVVFCLSLAGVVQAKVVKKCYIDGNDVAYQTGAKALSYDFHRLTIGAEGSLDYRYNGLKGTVDEFAIYDKILSDPCIAAHANSLPANYVATVTADAPVLWLRFEDPCSANGSTAADSSGNGQNGTYIGDDEVGDVNLVAGFVGNAAKFYGTAPVTDGNGTCIDVNDANGALELQDLTVEFWFKSTTQFFYEGTHYPKFFQHNGGTGSKSYGGMVTHDDPTNPGDPNNPTIGLIGGGTTEYDPVGVNITDDQWHHMVFTFDSTPDPCIEVGRYAEEVLEDNPALYVRCEALPLVDESGNGLWVDADSVVTIQKATGSMGNCARLNAGWIAAATTTYEPCSPVDYDHAYAFGDDITVEFWLYYPPGTVVDNYGGLWNQNAGEDYTTFSPGCTRAGDNCRMRCNENRDPCGVQDPGYAYAMGAWAADQNEWHHYVAIYDCCDDPCRIHVEWWTDSVQIKSSTYTPATFDNYLGPEMDHIMFGCYGSRDAPSGPYRQYMDEIAVYDYALPSIRIQAHYQAWQPRDCNELWDREMAEPWAVAMDKNKDCIVNLYDYVYIGLDWLLCNDPCDANCVPNW